jgi:hypothetical protein
MSREGEVTTVNDPAHWLERAREMHKLAQQASDLRSKLTMLEIVREYEKLAKRAEERSDGRKPRSK